MPEVNGDDPSKRPSTYILLVPCSTPDETNPLIAHAYEARQITNSKVINVLGWLTLDAARERFAEIPYVVRWASHAICTDCSEARWKDS